ncbi:MAG: hypothetical protein IIY62_00205 [Kiritimatiellae bacterium]|nr:hypothetical protein [Kiritimatiellia bacterium]
MSMEKISEMDALMGGGPARNAAEQNFDAAAFEKQKHELDNMRGRVKASDARIKELEKQLAELRTAKSGEDLVSRALSESEREKLAPEFLGAAAKLAATSAEQVRREYEERERARLEQEAQARAANEERAKENFARLVEGRFPGFLSSVSTGGPNNAQWRKFMDEDGYSASVNAAWNACNLEVLSQFIEQFNSKLGIRVPSGSQGTATSPDPRTLGSGAPVQTGGPNKVYTAEEYAALEKQAMQFRRRGDWEGYRKLNEELNTILAENRVKD